jgi:hypothetical protein
VTLEEGLVTELSEESRTKIRRPLSPSSDTVLSLGTPMMLSL